MNVELEKRVEERTVELTRVMEQLVQSQKMEAVGKLAGGIAHDFNTRIGVVLGYAELLLNRLEPDHPMRREITAIRNAAEGAAALTRQLLAFSRQRGAVPRALSLNEVVAGQMPMLQRLIREDIALAFTPDPETGYIQADQAHIEQVLLNLVVNARDATPHAGTITIETSLCEIGDLTAGQHPGIPRGAYGMLVVRDSGSGMPPEVRARIFEPFFATKEEGKGTGLGLSIVYGVVTESGGHIRVESAPGAGSTFRLYFPLAAAPSRMQGPSAPDPAPSRGSETVLVVENDHDMRELIEDVLRNQGYTVFLAQDGQAAVEEFERLEGRVDLLVTDVIMPRMNGPDLAARLQAGAPSLRVLYISGYTDRTLAFRGVDEHGIAYLPKPFKVDTLISKVREVLGP